MRRIKLRPMSSICFSPSSSFPLFSSYPFPLPHSFIRHRLAPGVAALWRLGRKTFPCAAVLFRFPREDSRHTHLRSFISKLHAHLGYNTPRGVPSGPSHSTFLLLPSPIWGYALCNAAHFEESSKQVFACILHVSPVLRVSV